MIARLINSMTEFKQAIGRGTARAECDYGKFYFTILDYTGSATPASLPTPIPTVSPALITRVTILNGRAARSPVPRSLSSLRSKPSRSRQR